MQLHNGQNNGKRPNDYSTWTQNFRRVGLLSTKDWQDTTRLGPVTSEHLSDPDVALFSEQIGGKYVMLHRPTPYLPWYIKSKYCPGAIWIAFSDDLLSSGWDEIQAIPKPWTIGEMKRKLLTKRGLGLYKKRSRTVEPVFGQVKSARACERFMQRGLASVGSEWKLICATYNLLKLFRSGQAIWN